MLIVCTALAIFPVEQVGCGNNEAACRYQQELYLLKGQVPKPDAGKTAH